MLLSIRDRNCSGTSSRRSYSFPLTVIVVFVVFVTLKGPSVLCCDGGAGFPDTVLHRAFEPYVTTKSKGTGLGLAIVKKIVDEHHGRVELANASPRGARITLIFPRRTAAA